MALFDDLLRKVRYTGDNVTRIGVAANEKGAGINLLTTPLDEWAELIRNNIVASGGTSGLTITVQVKQLEGSVVENNLPYISHVSVKKD